MIDTIAAPRMAGNAYVDSIFFEAIKARQHDDDKMAMELFEKCVRENQDFAAAYFELSKINKNNRNFVKSEEYIKKALRYDEKNKWYKREYAMILGERGAFEEAAAVAADLAKTEPHTVEYPLMAAEYYEHAKKYKEAIQYLDIALLQTGSDADILMKKAHVYLQKNEIEQAADVIKLLIAKEPKNGKFYKVLGEIYDNSKMLDKATEIYEKALKIIPQDPSLQLGLAEHSLKLGDTSSYQKYMKIAITNKEFESEVQLKILEGYLQSLPNDSVVLAEGMPIVLKLMDYHPDDADILVFYADFLESANQKYQAVDAYKKSLTINPSKFTVWIKLLQNYSDKKDADSLIKYSEKCIRLFPNQALANYYNGIGHFNKTEYSPAIKSINRAIDLQPDSKPDFLAAMYSTLGDIYNITKQYELSDNAFEKSIKYEPNEATVLNNYSYYLSLRGIKLDEAEAMSKKSLQISPGQATFLDTYGWILYKKGNYSEAKNYIEQSIKRNNNSSDGTIYDHLGNIYFKLNNKEKAIENWKIARDKGCDNPYLDKKINEEKLYE